MSTSTEIVFDPNETWKYVSPFNIPPNVPMTGEDSTSVAVAPWLAPDEPVSLNVVYSWME